MNSNRAWRIRAPLAVVASISVTLMLIIAVIFLTPASSSGEPKPPPLRFAGALEFGPDGVLFVGDNLGGAIYAFEMGVGKAPTNNVAINVDSIDEVVANSLGATKKHISINDMAVHPTSREIYLSVMRRAGEIVHPGIVRVDQAGNVHHVRLDSLTYTRQALSDMPDGTKHFRPRGMMGNPPSNKDMAKAKRPMRVLAIMDIEYYKGEVFVAGISNEEFSSTLRRMPYPFTGKHGSTNVRMFHVAHDQYETRAPIRSMVAKRLGEADYLIAAYTCSPVVLVPIAQLKDGARVTARTIGDIGNGQPIDMVAFKNKVAGGKEYLFVTNNSRMPQVFPIEGLEKATPLTKENTKRGMKMDAQGVFPMGPVGRPIMFVGTSLQADLLNDNFFVSLTRDPYTGTLDLESLATVFPVKLHYLYAEFDFPGVPHPMAGKKK